MTKETREIVTETMLDVAPYEFECSLVALQKRIAEWIAEYGPDTKIEWDPDRWFEYNSQPSPTFYIKRYRLETDSEMATRLLVHKARVDAIRERDRIEFERLKKQFGDK